MSDATKHSLGIADIIGDKRDRIIEIAQKHGASNVRVFGSVARGEARPDSDLDLLVDFKPDYSLRDHLGLLVDLEALLGYKVDVAIAADLRDELRPYILKDAAPL